MDNLALGDKMAFASIPCTCGELFQGALEGEPCLVSCPINIYSSAKITADQSGSKKHHGKKVEQAIEWLSARVGQKFGVEIYDSLPAGRGYGTSTADIGAALFSASQAFGLDLSASEASRVAVQIEPTDSTFFSGLTLFAHRSGNNQVILGGAPPAKLIILDPGGVVDSEEFNSHDWSRQLSGMAQEQKEAFLFLQQGIADGDLLAIGEASTLSAKYHQAILFNPLVEIARKLVTQVQAAGICRAHSGTIVGLLFPDDSDIKDVLRFLKPKLPKMIRIRTASLVGGGANFQDGSESEVK